MSQHSITKTGGLSNMLQVQKGQRQRMDTVTHVQSLPIKSMFFIKIFPDLAQSLMT